GGSQWFLIDDFKAADAYPSLCATPTPHSSSRRTPGPINSVVFDLQAVGNNLPHDGGLWLWVRAFAGTTAKPPSSAAACVGAGSGRAGDACPCAGSDRCR